MKMNGKKCRVIHSMVEMIDEIKYSITRNQSALHESEKKSFFIHNLDHNISWIYLGRLVL